MNCIWRGKLGKLWSCVPLSFIIKCDAMLYCAILHVVGPLSYHAIFSFRVWNWKKIRKRDIMKWKRIPWPNVTYNWENTYTLIICRFFSCDKKWKTAGKVSSCRNVCLALEWGIVQCIHLYMQHAILWWN